MIQPVSWIIWNSIAMFVGAYGAGMLPTVLKLDDLSLKKMNLLGAGLMVGTALSVIIPEGAEAFFASYAKDEEPPNGVFGLALTGGFLIMLILDSIKFSTSDAHQCLHSDDMTNSAFLELSKAPPALHEMAGFTTLVGILVHSAADGIALGAAAFSQNASTGALIALAIILHKAPTAFGLATFLLNSGWSFKQLQIGLLMFATAAPVVAVAGYLLLNSVPQLASPQGVALCLLLSGGTFLYAACIHILPEALHTPGREKHHRLSVTQVVVITAGAALPLIVSLFHSHNHGDGDHDHNLGHN
mmetsp:Transcript_12549/g.17151  ORF Transcript_12549/g.17151 Transcript_12549/m.17151 type:complete len:301 (-) Transcript_12549:325-1227(-)|eukprot:CAMPEP_0196581384 /NCGR_PEP_ID=MMETSP1081-20130531/33924_1 /TAXON_ID=36882 /ORGANISM="Pyramimonas amylifera, Strain CCMP720" /LENGTH=300 /DNA_ID=CAMNT_0041901597 /DNA_START=136 /DNA_END=1038 /DNA_ORIENTATION=+